MTRGRRAKADLGPAWWPPTWVVTFVLVATAVAAYIAIIYVDHLAWWLRGGL